MTRKAYRELFEAAYNRVDEVFQGHDDRYITDQLIMFFGFSEPKDYFELPRSGRLILALGNFEEAFRVGGISEFLENCGYCLPDTPGFLRELGCDDLANVLQSVLLRSEPALWGRSFWGHELDVTRFCHANGWFRMETEKLGPATNEVLSKVVNYAREHVALFRDYRPPESGM